MVENRLILWPIRKEYKMNLTDQQEGRKIRMMANMKMSELYASYWIAMATTGATTKRVVSRGNRRLTPMELTQDALDTALSHIHSISKTADNIALLLEGREKEIS